MIADSSSFVNKKSKNVYFYLEIIGEWLYNYYIVVINYGGPNEKAYTLYLL